MVEKKNKQTNRLYRIEIRNIFYVLLFCIIILCLTKFLKFIFSSVLNIHLGLNFQIDYLAIYGGFLSIILPVAILIAERIRDKHSNLVSEAYLHNTYMFPIIIYFVINLCIFTFESDQYYFIITGFLSTLMIIFLYYRSFMMISNHFYEKAQINLVKEDIIKKDLVEQISPFDDENLISKYKKYGIYVKQYDFISVSDYEKVTLYPDSDYLIIKNYNYKTFNKLIPVLKDINKDYILSHESVSNKIEISTFTEPNLILVFDALGTTVSRKDCWIYIYYKKDYTNYIDKIIKIVSNKVYKTSGENNHLFIEKTNQAIALKCIKSINDGSSSLFSDALDEYLDSYKIYINELIDKVGEYNYEVSYNHANSFYRIKTYDFLRNIQENVFDFESIIVKKDDSKLMNELISFLYEMMLYSNNKKELLSIQFLYNMYQYLNYYSLQLSDESSIKKIKLEIFEFLNTLKYDFRNSNSVFTHDVLLVCNKTVGNILYDLKDNEKFLYSYYLSLFDYINELEDEFEKISYDNCNDYSKKYYEDFKDIYKHYSSNSFAISAYLYNYYEKKSSDTNFLNLMIKNYYSNITNILLNTIDMEYNNRMYSWDSMEIRDSYEDYGVYNVNTVDYLIHLYVKIITSKDKRYLNIESSYQLSQYADRIISELNKVDKKDYIELFEKVKNDVEEEEKKYLRTTKISNEKIIKFKGKFLEEYSKLNRLMQLFKDTNNYKIVERKKTGVNYIGISNIVDKTYFLDKIPNNRCIIWTNFEENFAYSFIEAEENKFVKSLINKSEYIDESVNNYLNSLTISKLKKMIIFSDYDTIYNLFDIDAIDHSARENNFANLYLLIKGIRIPVYIVNQLEERDLYISYSNKLGRFEKSSEDFKIEINDFLDNEKMLDECMKKDINGLDLIGDERRNHLLESVDLLIEEYVVYNDQELVSYKFNH